VLGLAIRWLGTHATEHDATLLYVSDHGESLGENNLYLHGLPSSLAPREQKHVPMLAWFGADGTGRAATRLSCLQGRRAMPLSHDHLFHTVLGLLRIEASEYASSLDAFAPCSDR
jgi:lipid A ethanolaminephosphotransferase